MEELRERLKERLTFFQKFAFFIRTQGVIGLAVAIVIGGAVQRVVTALVNDIITPIIGILLGKTTTLKELSITVGGAKILWGDFVSTFIDFLIIAFVIYMLVKVLRVDALDKKKE